MAFDGRDRRAVAGNRADAGGDGGAGCDVRPGICDRLAAAYGNANVAVIEGGHFTAFEEPRAIAHASSSS